MKHIVIICSVIQVSTVSYQIMDRNIYFASSFCTIPYTETRPCRLFKNFDIPRKAENEEDVTACKEQQSRHST